MTSDVRQQSSVVSTPTRKLPSDRSLLSSTLGHVLHIDERKAQLDWLRPDGSSTDKLDRLQEVGRLFLCGYNAAVSGEDAAAISARAKAFAESLRGFIVEGGAMGTAVADAFRPMRPRLPAYLTQFERDYAYLAHVGAGWSLGRLPWRRRRIIATLDPLLAWLAYDGAGFHDTYFSPRRVQRDWRRFRSGYAARAYDQGVGRALWFITGGSVDGAMAVIQSIDPVRAGDLWSGLGLAMTYAGAADPAELSGAAAAAGEYRGAFRQGIAFACEAFHLAGFIPAHAERAAETLGSTATDLVDLVRRCRAQLPSVDGRAPRYEMWRASVGAALA